MAATKYIVGETDYLLKDGKVYQTGEEITLTDKEFKNVEDKVYKASSDEGKALAEQKQEEKQEDEKQEDSKQEDKK